MLQATRIIRIVFVAVASMFTSCFSRLERPKITGVIVDYDNRPINNCKVGETITDTNGYFTLPEIFEYGFFTSNIIGADRAPLIVFENIEKQGYEENILTLISGPGGRSQKSFTWNTDTIHLKKGVTDLYKIIRNHWILKNDVIEDTIYLVKPRFHKRCSSLRCQTISSKFFYNYYDYSAFQEMDSSSGEFRSFFRKVSFVSKFHDNINSNLTFDKKDLSITKHKKVEVMPEKIKYSFKKDSIIIFEGNSKILEGEFKLIDFDYEYLILKKL